MVRFWAAVPAAGVGRRMGADRPKQYLELCGRPILQHTLERLGNHPRIAGLVVALRGADPWWPRLELDVRASLYTAVGGQERQHSVAAALRVLLEHASSTDWVLVHDAVRPCVRGEDIDRLIDEVAEHPVGGLLGIPVRDTIKRAGGGGEVAATVSREALWQAQTPQMFRLGALAQALDRAGRDGVALTDEAQAMEIAHAPPRLVQGHADNIKVTCAEDVEMAELYLARQGGSR